MKKIKKRKYDAAIVLLAVVFSGFSFLFMHEFFKHNISNFSIEILAAVLGTIFTTITLTVMLKIQRRDEKEKEFCQHIFEKKTEIYQKLLKTIFKADDDGILDKQEINDIENYVGEISLVAGANLVSVLSQFTLQLKIYGCMYSRNMKEDQIKHFVNYFQEKKELMAYNKKTIEEEIGENNFKDYFINLDDVVQSLREDLSVVEGDIRKMISSFIDIPINQFKLIRNPNKIE